ncbi:MarR family winged helix-turn-helix transcriptional regulator [Streptomyces umbrinus]|uniref:MarR family winged helix-turn-helix transcriptional regulator n=1 Tax=Streptomyces umbrinus TaxID=67370 RepID=UPI001BC91E07|nr:MarR family transcriptional regulator [Streptomyces umbrinus]
MTYLVKQVERGVRSMLDETVRRFGLTTPQYAALSVLARRSGLSSAQLARRAFVTPQAMNQIVAQLEAAELIAREPDPANWRILRASLTREGERRLAACERAVDRIEDQMLQALDSESVERLREGLLACAAALRGLSESVRSE